MMSIHQKYVFIALLFVFFNLEYINCKNNERKSTLGPKTRLPNDKLFQDQAAFCEGCYGFTHGKYLL